MDLQRINVLASPGYLAIAQPLQGVNFILFYFFPAYL